MGNGIILTDNDIIEISELLDENHKELKRKVDAIVELIKLERDYRANVNSVNTEYFKEVEANKEKEDK